MWVLFAAFFISVAAYDRQRHFTTFSANRSSNVPDLAAPLLVRAEVRSQPPLPLQVRFSLLQPTNDTGSLIHTQGPFLQNALCWAETNLAPSLAASAAFRRAPQYVVYTDNHTHSYARDVFREFPRHRYRLVNLDEDPRDKIRMGPFDTSELDDKNLASVRRTLADVDHLTSQSGRLLLGTDVKFLRPPHDFLEAAANLPRQQTIYMIDRFWEGETAEGRPVSDVKYRMNYSGPQCPGLLGDFVYMSPGLEVTLENLQSKMLWYIRQPRVLERTIPRCPQSCLASNGLHALDQFALVLALGEAVRPTNTGCHALDAEAYSHWYPRTPSTQVTHDKNMDACTLRAPLPEAFEDHAAEDKMKMLLATASLLLIAILSLLCMFLDELAWGGKRS